MIVEQQLHFPRWQNAFLGQCSESAELFVVNIVRGKDKWKEGVSLYG